MSTIAGGWPAGGQIFGRTRGDGHGQTVIVRRMPDDRPVPAMNRAHMEFCSSPEWRAMIEEQILPAGPARSRSRRRRDRDRARARASPPTCCDSAGRAADRGRDRRRARRSARGTAGGDERRSRARRRVARPGSPSAASAGRLVQHAAPRADRRRRRTRSSPSWRRVLRAGAILVAADAVYSTASWRSTKATRTTRSIRTGSTRGCAPPGSSGSRSAASSSGGCARPARARKLKPTSRATAPGRSPGPHEFLTRRARR